MPAPERGEVTTPRGRPALPDDVASAVKALNPVEAVLADPRSAEPLTDRQARLAEAWAMDEEELDERLAELGLEPFANSRRGKCAALSGYPLTQQGTASARDDLRAPNVVAAYVVAARRRVLEVQPDALAAVVDLATAADSDRVRLDAARHLQEISGMFGRGGGGGDGGGGVSISIRLGSASHDPAASAPTIDAEVEKNER